MRTRVVRYWYKTDWLYKVEKWAQSEKDEEFLTWEGTRFVPSVQSRKKGEWHWDLVESGLSRERAEAIAGSLADGRRPPDADVVAEFGSL